MAKLFANSGDPDQIWVCTVCQVPFYGSPNYNGLNIAGWVENSVDPDQMMHAASLS